VDKCPGAELQREGIGVSEGSHESLVRKVRGPGGIICHFVLFTRNVIDVEDPGLVVPLGDREMPENALRDRVCSFGGHAFGPSYRGTVIGAQDSGHSGGGRQE
jgi:hypothetical protein